MTNDVKFCEKKNDFLLLTQDLLTRVLCIYKCILCDVLCARFFLNKL